MVAMFNQPGPTRLNLLLSYAGWQSQNWAEQLPRLLEPLGVASIRVESGREATEVLRNLRIHIAVVDLGLPLERKPIPGPSAAETGGTRLLQVLRRLQAPPPTVVVRRPMDRAVGDQRTLHEALREGAFAVLDVPVPVEQMLEVLRRILRRHYADAWPEYAPDPPYE